MAITRQLQFYAGFWSVPYIRDILEHFFFHVIAKVFGGTVAQGVFLAYKCWYKRIIGVPEQIFLVAQWHTVAQQISHWYWRISMVLGAERGFCFQKKQICPKISLI